MLEVGSFVVDSLSEQEAILIAMPPCFPCWFSDTKQRVVKMPIRMRISHTSTAIAAFSAAFAVACGPSEREFSRLSKRVDSLAITLVSLTAAIESNSLQIRPATATVDTFAAAAMGNISAQVVIVQFTDYQCPYCARYASTTLPIIRDRYVNTGKVRYILRDAPGPARENGVAAAVAARCAGNQDKYWAFHDDLFRRHKELSDTVFEAIARDQNLDSTRFRNCLKSGNYDQKVAADVRSAASARLNATPSFVIGRPTIDGQVKGTVVFGAQPPSRFEAEIQRVLGAEGT